MIVFNAVLTASAILGSCLYFSIVFMSIPVWIAVKRRKTSILSISRLKYIHGYSSLKSCIKLIASELLPAPVSAAKTTLSCNSIFALLPNSGKDLNSNTLSLAVSNIFIAASNVSKPGIVSGSCSSGP